MKKQYSLSEVADYLSVSKETLRRWDKNGKLKAVRMHNNYRYYSADPCGNLNPSNFCFTITLSMKMILSH